MTAWFTLIDLYLTSTWHVFLFHSSGPCLWENINLYLKQPAALDPSSFNFELYVGQFFSSQYSHSKFYFYNPPASADRLYSIHLLSVTVSHNSITTCTQCGARLVITRLQLLIPVRTAAATFWAELAELWNTEKLKLIDDITWSFFSAKQKAK